MRLDTKDGVIDAFDTFTGMAVGEYRILVS